VQKEDKVNHLLSNWSASENDLGYLKLHDNRIADDKHPAHLIEHFLCDWILMFPICDIYKIVFIIL
jgi:hypothetical protein